MIMSTKLFFQALQSMVFRIMGIKCSRNMYIINARCFLIFFTDARKSFFDRNVFAFRRDRDQLEHTQIELDDKYRRISALQPRSNKIDLLQRTRALPRD